MTILPSLIDQCVEVEVRVVVQGVHDDIHILVLVDQLNHQSPNKAADPALAPAALDLIE